MSVQTLQSSSSSTQQFMMISKEQRRAKRTSSQNTDSDSFLAQFETSLTPCSSGLQVAHITISTEDEQNRKTEASQKEPEPSTTSYDEGVHHCGHCGHRLRESPSKSARKVPSRYCRYCESPVGAWHD
eukprot:g4457.t1